MFLQLWPLTRTLWVSTLGTDPCGWAGLGWGSCLWPCGWLGCGDVFLGWEWVLVAVTSAPGWFGNKGWWFAMENAPLFKLLLLPWVFLGFCISLDVNYKNFILSSLLCLGFDCMPEQATLESIINSCIIHPTISSCNGISSKTATLQRFKD